MLKAEEARALYASWEAKRTEEAKKKADEVIGLISEAIAREAADGKHSFSCAWNVARWESEEARDLGEKAIREAGYDVSICRNNCLITW